MNPDRTFSGPPIHERDREALRINEVAYRRGYQQGADVVIRLMRDGLTEADILNWINGPLDDWRYRRSRDTATIPPSPKKRR